MQPFHDAEGREWKLSMTVPGIERVLKATGLNIVNPLAPKVGAPQHEQPDILTLLLNDVVLFSKVLGALLARQFEKAEVKPEDFAEALDTAALGAAWQAFREEWNDFFRSRNQPEMISLLDQQAKNQGTQAGAMTTYADEAANISMKKIEKKLGEERAKVTASPEATPPETLQSASPSTASDSATSGPESSVSTPAA